MSIIDRLTAELRRLARRVGIIADETPAKEAAPEPSQTPPAPVAGEGEERKRNRALDEPEAATGGGASPQKEEEPPRMDWRFGGFDGGKAKEDSRCRLGGVKITKDRIAYKWERGIPGDWKRGKTSKGMMVIAAAFYWDGARWVGGKMDWTDEARTARECTHIHDGYNGWQSAGWDGAKRRAFCVASADGKFRSNLAEG
jgi:hypothetical protein